MKLSIILASFGVINKELRAKTIDLLADDISKAFKNFEVRQAFTSNFSRRKLNSQGLNILSIEEQINDLKSEGYEKIYILPSLLTPGEEFDNKIKIFASDEIIILPPLFTLNCDTEFDQKAFKVIIDCFKTNENEELILIGHGSPHRHNSVYENLQRLADDQNLKIHIGVIEPNDTPNFENVLDRLKKFHTKKILLAPLLFNGGTHVNEDIAGENDSWKTKLIDQGFEVRICFEGLGTYKNFRQLYVDRLKNFLQN